MSLTHYDGQRLAECPECENTTRLKAERATVTTPVYCGCGNVWDPRGDGE